MLDDLKYIHEKDNQDALGTVSKQWQQLSHDFKVNFAAQQTINNLVLAGMGGSALPGPYLQTWPGVAVPFEVVRGYELPPYVDQHTLYIASSYSGNTEEALSALAEAEERQAQIVVIAAGGKLLDIAKAKKYPLFQIPTGIQPRMTSFYFYAAFIQLLEPLGLVPKESRKTLQSVGSWLGEQVALWQPEIPSSKNPAKQLAQELMGKTVIVYGGPKMFPAANKFKISLNENAKNLAWVYQYPEFNHNEFIGWSSHPVDKPFAVVEFRSTMEHPRVQKRFIVSERLLSGMRPTPQVVEPQGDTVLKQLIWSVSFGDLVSVYVALLNGVNPVPVDLVERFKRELG
jgi:glucose/mannose-6-phosphate isomerase